jgi:hypothetical protein
MPVDAQIFTSFTGGEEVPEKFKDTEAYKLVMALVLEKQIPPVQ